MRRPAPQASQSQMRRLAECQNPAVAVLSVPSSSSSGSARSSRCQNPAVAVLPVHLLPSPPPAAACGLAIPEFGRSRAGGRAGGAEGTQMDGGPSAPAPRTGR